ncbi:hypothetical protein [Vibrio nigripulchritudo]|uniref:hypothetical protein n=1 Tax=Vibrio nigripulchritudo TaxID=28173 RepID=UPI00190CEE86|nr:hypothetical protein [Vibrio nigripulchritudo]
MKKKSKIERTKKKTSPLKHVVVALLISAAGYQLYSYGLLDSLIWGQKTDSAAAIVEQVVPEEQQEEVNHGLKEHRFKSTLEEPKLLGIHSYDELTNLALLVLKVKKSEKDAATLFGLQRISIAHKRERAIEKELEAQIAKSDLQIAVSLKEKRELNKTPITHEQEMEPLKPKFVIPTQADTTQTTLGLPSTVANSFDTIELSEPVRKKNGVTIDDFSLKGVVGSVAIIRVRDELHDSIRVGHVIKGLKVQLIDKTTNCVTFSQKDGKVDVLCMQ